MKNILLLFAFLFFAISTQADEKPGAKLTVSLSIEEWQTVYARIAIVKSNLINTNLPSNYVQELNKQLDSALINVDVQLKEQLSKTK
jgi:hypothetical protein